MTPNDRAYNVFLRPFTERYHIILTTMQAFFFNFGILGSLVLVHREGTIAFYLIDSVAVATSGRRMASLSRPMDLYVVRMVPIPPPFLF